MAEKTNRLYGGITDDAMLTGSETMMDLYHIDLPLFTALDASLNAAFETEWLGKIDLARDFPTDESIGDLIEELTATMQEKWDACKAYFQDAKYFIEKAFPGNRARHKQFGFDDYERMSTDQDKVLVFMDQFHDTAQANKVALIAAGYTQLKIDGIDTAAEEFRTANRAQEAGKKDRLLKTQTRIGLMNDVWKMNQKVNRASKNVFRGNFAKLQQYLLPGAGSNEPPEFLSVKGKVTNSVTGQGEPEVNVHLPDHDVISVTDDSGNFGFTQELPAGPTPLTADKTGLNGINDSVTIISGQTVTKNFTMTPV